MFKEVLVQEAALPILEEFGVRTKTYQENYFTSDSVETVACLIAKAIQAGLSVLN